MRAIAEIQAGRVALCGIPVDANSSHLRGPASAPTAIRSQLHSGSANYTTERGVDLSQWVADIGDLALVNETGSEDDADVITSTISALLAAGAKPLSIGGDHSVTYPILRSVGPAWPGLTIVHIDAHPDLYGNFGDNRLSHASPFARIMEEGLCERLIQVGIRTANAHQVEQARRFGVETVEARFAESFDPAAVTGPIYVSCDVDGLDPAFAPGVSHHEPGGLTSRQVFDLIAKLGGEVVGADVVEVNPACDVVGMTAMLGAKLVKELAGAMVGNGS